MSSPSSLRSCKGLVYAITGGAGAIGGATAVRLAELGAAGLALADIDEDALAAKKSEITEKYPDCKVMTSKVDVADENQVNAWTDAIIAEFGRLDGAGNIAGGEKKHGPEQTILNTDTETWQYALNINLTGTMNCMRAQLKVITRPGGSILNCSSGAGLRGIASFSAYGAAKWGIRGLSKTAAVEYGHEGVRVNTLVPGPIGGPTVDRLAAEGLLDLDWFGSHSALGRIGQPEEIAKSAAFVLSPDAAFVTGSDIVVDGGGSALPGFKSARQ